MIELELLKTALLLGGLILLGGCYGILYGIGKLANWRAMRLAGFACYGLQCVIALACCWALAVDDSLEARCHHRHARVLRDPTHHLALR